MAMDFIDQVRQFSKRVESLKDNIQTEEATKTSIIMPFFALLGYDVFNPQEFVPEFTADVGIKKGEKVDYAILQDDQPVILIEAKWVGEPLEKHDSQLFRYFGTTEAKFGILTNGILYRFFTDLDTPNKMDEKPFLEINILDIKENQVAELKKFCKSNFNLEEIVDAASELKYSYEFKNVFASQLVSPSDEFVRLFLSGIYNGMKTQTVIDKFRPILKKALNNFINELMSDKIKSALTANETEAYPEETKDEEPISVENQSKIATTEEEIEAYYLVRNILKDIVPGEDITYKDTINYINILYKGNIRKWVCRFILSATQKILIVPDEDKKEIRIPLTDLHDLEQHREQLIDILKRYL